jgi:hypothetical protein
MRLDCVSGYSMKNFVRFIVEVSVMGLGNGLPSI